MSDEHGDFDEADEIQRLSDMAWDLYDAQPTHPRIPELVAAVLAAAPYRSGMRILLAMHLEECGRADEAREVLQKLIGERNPQYVNAVSRLARLELSEHNYLEAERWAAEAVREEPEDWRHHMDLAEATAMSGRLEEGWRLADDAIELCAKTRADHHPVALGLKAMILLGSFAPPATFIPAAEAAIEADPTDEDLPVTLIWAYVHQGRLDDAEELGLRMLRIDPTNELAAGAVQMIRRLTTTLESADQSVEDLMATGMLERLWTQLRDERLGLDLPRALEALGAALPSDLAATLLPAADEETAHESGGSGEIAAWHDGQRPGGSAIWGLELPFRLMSAAEIAVMDEAIEASPEDYPDWQAEVLADHYTQLMTDDAGSYVIEVATGELAIRRAGVEDVIVAPNLTDYIWDRVAAYGGDDPRPLHRRGAVA